MEAKQTPLIELLEQVPHDARVVVEHDQFSSSSHPVGRLCHEAAAELRRLHERCEQWRDIHDAVVADLDKVYALLRQALEALESDPISHAGLVNRKQAITALRQALVDADDTSEKRVDEKAKREHEPVCAHVLKTEQEPVLWLKTWPDGSVSVLKTKSHAFADHELEPLYTSPPRKREWVGLTYEEIQIVASKKWWNWEDEFDIEGFSRAIERVLKEKNHG